jgi:hypothetical protein
MDTNNRIKLFGKNLFGFWLPFIGFTTYVEYDDIFNPKYKLYEHVLLIQWVVGWGLIYKTEIEILEED